MTLVTLQLVTRANWREALELSVEPGQQHFVSEVVPPVAIALAKAYIRPRGWPVLPHAIYDGLVMVGFFNLTYEPGSTEDYWLQHFFIDRRYQRRGYGAAALQALVGLLKDQFPACRSLQLSVHRENHPARRLYEKSGFVQTERHVDGEPVYRLEL